MAYFDEVYLKRVNRHGTTIQDRVQNRKEHDFEAFKEKSVNKVDVYVDSNIFDGVLQTKKSSEDEIIDYLLVNKKFVWPDGTIITTQEVTGKRVKKNWLTFHLDDFVSVGYNRYQIVLLDREISWLEDGKIKTSPIKLVGSKNGSITSKFTIDFSVAARYVPNKVLNMVIPSQSGLKKNTRIKIADEVWKVSGIDKISVPGVSYVTLEEDYIDKENDITYADEGSLLNWSIQSTLGNTIRLQGGETKALDFYAYFGDELRNEELTIEIENGAIAQCSQGVIQGLEIGETRIKVSIMSIPSVYRYFDVFIEDETTENFTVLGPDKVRISMTEEYAIIGNDEGYTYVSKEGCFDCTCGDSVLYITGKHIGKDSLEVKKGEEVIYSKPISIISIWMEG